MNKKIWHQRIMMLFAMCMFVLTGCSGTTTEQKTNQQPKATNEQKTTTATKQDINSKNEKNNRMAVTVLNVVDGDTIDVKLPNGNKERIRLLLVDTPETKHPNKPVQPFGPEASEFTKKTLTEQRVELEFDVQERDKYGRLLAYVYLNDQMFNQMLLEKGLARVAVFPPNTKYVDEFRAIQEKAQKEAIGIWSIENYVTDRGYNADGKTTQGKQPSTSKPQQPAKQQAQTNSGCSNPTIKGNITSKGDKIYHVSGGAFYEKTKAEEMFCTEKDAEAAGYRKSQR